MCARPYMMQKPEIVVVYSRSRSRSVSEPDIVRRVRARKPHTEGANTAPVVPVLLGSRSPEQYYRSVE